MKIITEGRSSAWCLHRDGSSVPVNVHPFGALGEDAIEDAAWLYIHDSAISKDKLISYIANQTSADYGITAQWSDEEIEDIVFESIGDIECLKSVAGRSGVMDAVYESLISIKHYAVSETDDLATLTSAELDALGKEIKQHLNQNWMRVRLGSEYQNYTERRGALYFRTSSTDGFDWYPVMLKFIDQLSQKGMTIGEITVERDISATGERRVYIDHMSMGDFLMRKPEVIESVVQCGTILEALYE